jgi:hypothetical protein
MLLEKKHSKYIIMKMMGKNRIQSFPRNKHYNIIKLKIVFLNSFAGKCSEHGAVF